MTFQAVVDLLFIAVLFLVLGGVLFAAAFGYAARYYNNSAKDLSKERPKTKPSGIKRGVHHADDEALRKYVIRKNEREREFAKKHPYVGSEVLNGERE